MFKNRLIRTAFQAAVYSILLASVLNMPANSLSSEQVSVSQLPNGLKVIISVDRALPLASVDLWVRAGTVFETSDNAGVAHCLEHTIFKGTKKRPPGRIDIEMENVGAYINASTSRDWVRFYATVATPFIPLAIDVISDAILNPLFDEKELEKEKSVIINEIAGRNANYEQIISDHLSGLLYGGHQYAVPVTGFAENIRKITRKQVIDYHSKHYTAGAMTIVVVGNVDPKSILQQVTEKFSPAVNKPAVAWPEIPKPVTATLEKTIKTPQKDGEYLGIGFLGPSMDDPEDVWVMDVLISHLVRGKSGKLWEKLVNDNKVASSLSISFLTCKLPALVSIIAKSEKGRVNESLAIISNEIRAIRDAGISDADLALAKRHLLGTHAFDTETASGQAASLGFYSMLSTEKHGIEYENNIRLVTAQRVREIATKYLDISRCAIVRSVN